MFQAESIANTKALGVKQACCSQASESLAKGASGKVAGDEAERKLEDQIL